MPPSGGGAQTRPERGRGRRGAIRQGFVVEASNPKTAAFFLALIPQFVDPAAGPVALQFCVLGLVSVVLNSATGVAAILGASWVRERAAAGGPLVVRLRKLSALILGGLGVSLILTRRPA